MGTIMSEWTPIAPFFVTARHVNANQSLEWETTANLLIETLAHYREQRKFLLHEFVIMRDHVHTLLTPAPEIPLAPAMQFIRGAPYRGPLRAASHD
jgi:putative transposase